MGPLGQEHSPRQKGVSSFPEAGIRRFSPANPLSPLLFAETKKGDQFSFSRAFWAHPPFLPGQQENGSERPTDLEMISPF